ncbi:MAG: aminotransferase class I/II-fold pyridoxal phosphate-dependent enzyme [Candidatus Hydrothermarchaeota archaeon]
MRDKSKIADRIKKVPPSGIREFFEMVIGMEDVVSLGVGEPDFVTPWHIREAAIYSLEKGYTTYTSNYGLLELREAISQQLYSDYSVYYDPSDQLLITTGVSEGYDLAVRAIVDVGDEVIVPEPCYVMYKPCIIFAGGKPVEVPTFLSNEFKVTAEQIEEKITDKTKAIVIGYPNNPTGATMGKKDLEEIADVVNEHNLIVISDEVYDKLTYEGKHTCFSSLNGMEENTILLNGFSKAYAMTGLRIGYAASTPEIIEAMMKIHQYSMLCAPITGQFAAIEAIQNGEKEMKAMVKEYNRRRRLIVKGLNKIGLYTFEPKGAFYAFPSIDISGLTSKEFAERLLKEKKVAVVPGDAFGSAGEGFVRCAYAASREAINEAISRMESFLHKLR